MPINSHALDERDPRFADQRWLLDRNMSSEQRRSLMLMNPHALHRTP